MREKKKRALIEFMVFIAVINLPFIYISTTLGFNTFLDSFENPDSYQFLTNLRVEGSDTINSHVIIQKSSHPAFDITYGDIIVYYEEACGFQYGIIDLVSTEFRNKVYYILSDEGQFQYQFVFEQQIIGKVISDIGTDIWSALSLELWDITITRLNALSLFSSQ